MRWPHIAIAMPIGKPQKLLNRSKTPASTRVMNNSLLAIAYAEREQTPRWEVKWEVSKKINKLGGSLYAQNGVKWDVSVWKAGEEEMRYQYSTTLLKLSTYHERWERPWFFLCGPFSPDASSGSTSIRVERTRISRADVTLIDQF